MPNALKGVIAGFVATLVLSALMIVNGVIGLVPQIDIIRLLTTLTMLSVASAWMDHFIVGTLIWGLLFAGFDAVATRPAPWLKGMIFGVFAWLMMMLIFLPLAGAGLFGAKLGSAAPVGLLILHLIYGLVLGATYGLLGALAPVKATVNLSAGANPSKQAVVVKGRAPNPNTNSSADINDYLPSSSPSGKTVLMIVGGVAGFFALMVLAVEFRAILGL